MNKTPNSAQDLFLRLGSTPWTRSARADRLFRKLRDELDGDVSTQVVDPTAPAMTQTQRASKLAAE